MMKISVLFLIILINSGCKKVEGETREHFKNLEDTSNDLWAYPAVTWIEKHASLHISTTKVGIHLNLGACLSNGSINSIRK